MRRGGQGERERRIYQRGNNSIIAVKRKGSKRTPNRHETTPPTPTQYSTLVLTRLSPFFFLISMKLCLANPATGQQKTIDIDDERKV